MSRVRFPHVYDPFTGNYDSKLAILENVVSLVSVTMFRKQGHDPVANTRTVKGGVVDEMNATEST